MSKVAIITDSNAGLSVEEIKEHGIFVVPMPFYFNDEVFFENIDLTQEKFYEMMDDDTVDIKTSMPQVGDVMDLWNEALKEYDEVVYIPMSSGLSSSCETATMLAEDFDNKVFVVNNQRISVTQKLSVYDALKLAKEGKSGREIKEILEKSALDANIYIMVDTLKYLKKGGRVTPAVAALGTLLKIKPVLQINGEKLDRFSTARTVKIAKNVMIEAIKDNIATKYNGDLSVVDICMAYTKDIDAAEEFKKEVESHFPGMNIIMDPLSLSVSCHIGPGALAITVTKKLQ